MTNKLSVRQVKPTQAELRRIVRDRKLAKGLAQRAWEEKQKAAWQAYCVVCDRKQSTFTRERALRRMLHLGHGSDWWATVAG